jgi:hypothetical protein
MPTAICLRRSPRKRAAGAEDALWTPEATRCVCCLDERSAPEELMIPKILSVEELMSLASEGSRVLERLSRASPGPGRGQHLGYRLREPIRIL